MTPGIPTTLPAAQTIPANTSFIAAFSPTSRASQGPPVVSSEKPTIPSTAGRLLLGSSAVDGAVDGGAGDVEQFGEFGGGVPYGAIHDHANVDARNDLD